MLNRFFEKLKEQKKQETPVDEKSEALTNVFATPIEEIEIDNDTTVSTELAQTLDDNNTSGQTDFVEVIEEKFPPEWLLEKSDDLDIQRCRDSIITHMERALAKGSLGNALAKEYINSLPLHSGDVIAQYGFTSDSLVRCIKIGDTDMFLHSRHDSDDTRHYNHKFDGKFTTDVADALIDAKEYGKLLENLKYFTNIDVSVVHQIINLLSKGDNDLKKGFNNLDTFLGTLHKYKNSFDMFDQELLDYILSSEDSYYAIWMIEKFDFPGVNYESIIDNLLEKNKGSTIINHFDSLKDKISIDSIVEKFGNKNQLHTLFDTYDYYKLGITDQSIADTCLQYKDYKTLAKILPRLKGLNISVGEVLINNGYSKDVDKNLESFNQE